MIYCYRSRPLGKREKGIAAALLLLGGFSLSLSLLPNFFLFWLYRLFAIVFFVGFAAFFGRYCLGDYTYAVESDSRMGDLPDLVITKHRRGRGVVVCRVSVGDVIKVTPVRQDNRKDVKKESAGGRCFCYTARMGTKNTYLLTLRDGEERIFVLIEADERLISLLSFQ